MTIEDVCWLLGLLVASIVISFAWQPLWDLRERWRERRATRRAAKYAPWQRRAQDKGEPPAFQVLLRKR
jgi:hypothetical protein